jgi:hypothetical protein
MPLFEVAILQKTPKKKDDESSGKEVLVYGPKAVVARDAQAAGFSALMGADAPKDLDMDHAQVIIRPFG